MSRRSTAVRQRVRDARRAAAASLGPADLRHLVVVTYFATYALLLSVSAGRPVLNDATRGLPAAVRPPPLLPIEAVFGLPRSVSMGVLSLSTAVAAVALLVGAALVQGSTGRERDPSADRRSSRPVVRAPSALRAGDGTAPPELGRLFGGREDSDREVQSLEEVFRHGGPGARLRSTWHQRAESGARTPRLRVAPVQAELDEEGDGTETGSEAHDEDVADAEQDDEWPGDWHAP